MSAGFIPQTPTPLPHFAIPLSLANQWWTDSSGKEEAHGQLVPPHSSLLYWAFIGDYCYWIMEGLPSDQSLAGSSDGRPSHNCWCVTLFPTLHPPLRQPLSFCHRLDPHTFRWWRNSLFIVIFLGRSVSSPPPLPSGLCIPHTHPNPPPLSGLTTPQPQPTRVHWRGSDTQETE